MVNFSFRSWFVRFVEVLSGFWRKVCKKSVEFSKEMGEETESRWLTYEEMCDELGICVSTFYRWKKKGYFDVRPGKGKSCLFRLREGFVPGGLSEEDEIGSEVFDEGQWFGRKQLCELLGITKTTFCRWKKQGRFDEVWVDEDGGYRYRYWGNMPYEEGSPEVLEGGWMRRQELCRHLGIAVSTFYTWKRKGRFESFEVKRGDVWYRQKADFLEELLASAMEGSGSEGVNRGECDGCGSEV